MLKQIPTSDYNPEGKLPVALLMLSLEELEVGKHLRFEADVDDLGELHWATVQVASGATYAFLRYDHGAQDVQVFGDPVKADLGELAQALNIPIGILAPLEIQDRDV